MTSQTIMYLAAAVSIVSFAIVAYFGERHSQYEFEHRTEGGMVTFPSYGASVFHGLKRLMLQLLAVVSFFSFGLAFLIYMIK